jgi:hypothetical protein
VFHATGKTHVKLNLRQTVIIRLQQVLDLHGFELRGFVDTQLRYCDLRLDSQYVVQYVVLFFLQLHMFLYLCTR